MAKSVEIAPAAAQDEIIASGSSTDKKVPPAEVEDEGHAKMDDKASARAVNIIENPLKVRLFPNPTQALCPPASR